VILARYKERRADSPVAWWTRVVGVGLLGSILGFWLFGVPGAPMLGAIGFLAALLHALAAARLPGPAGAVTLVLAAAALGASSTPGWGAADLPDGSRINVSPVGLSHVLTPGTPASGTADCGWHPASGHAQPCAVIHGGGASFARLRIVFPLVIASALAALVGALFSLRPVWRGRRRLAAGIASAGALAAPILFASGAPAALVPLAGHRFGMGGTLGTMLLSAGALLCVAVAASPRRGPEGDRG